jgi:transcriptional regulator with XRE-family HTH domain
MHPGFRRMCERNRITAAEIAAACGVSAGHMSNFLAGRLSAGSHARLENKVALFLYGKPDTRRLRRVLLQTSPAKVRV